MEQNQLKKICASYVEGVKYSYNKKSMAINCLSHCQERMAKIVAMSRDQVQHHVENSLKGLSAKNKSKYLKEIEEIIANNVHICYNRDCNCCEMEVSFVENVQMKLFATFYKYQAKLNTGK